MDISKFSSIIGATISGTQNGNPVFSETLNASQQSVLSALQRIGFENVSDDNALALEQIQAELLSRKAFGWRIERNLSEQRQGLLTTDSIATLDAYAAVVRALNDGWDGDWSSITWPAPV